MAILPDGDTIIGVDGHVMQTWSISKRQRLARISGGEDGITLAAAPNGEYALVRIDGRYARYDILSGEWTANLDIAPAVSSLAIRGDSAEIAFIEDEGVTKVTPHLVRLDRFAVPDLRAISVAYDPNDGNVLIGNGDGSIVRWLR